MSARRRFALVTVILAVGLIVSVVVSVDDIQRDLLVRTQQTLAASGVAFYGVEFEGRDARLAGFIGSAEQARHIENLVERVAGVRSVRNDLLVERIVEASPEDTAGRRSRELPRVRMQRLGNRLIVSGRLPSDGSADDFLVAARARYGTSNVSGSLGESSSVERSDWIDGLPRLLEILDALDPNARIAIVGRSATLFGQLTNPAVRDRVETWARTLAGLTWRFDLLALDGATGGAG